MEITVTGYTHTCASCEAKLKVHDRYVGRTLHCPHCGTEFLADPSLADVDDLVEDLAPKKHRSVPWLTILILLILAAVVTVLGTAGQEGLLADLFRPSRAPGQFGVLTLDDRDRVPAAMDHETVVFVVDALEDEDPGSIEALKAQGKIIEVVSGTKIKLIERSGRQRVARVRVLEGPWTGRVIWVPLMAVR